MLFVTFLLFCAATAQSQLNYNIGDDFTFQFSSQINHAAQPTSGSASQSSVSSMTGIMEMEVQDDDGTLYYFVMNLFNVDVEASNGARRSTKITSGDDGLGPDMFFSMTRDGQIPTIWYQDGDSQFFINIKASAINALQTHLVAANQKNVFPEQDLIGSHTTRFTGYSTKAGLLVSKYFTQDNVIQFADKLVTKATFALEGLSNVSVHPSGYITGSTTQQQVKFVSAVDPSLMKKFPTKKTSDSNLGFDSNLLSFATLNLGLASRTSARLTSKFGNVQKISTNLLEIGSLAALSPLTNLPKVSSIDELLSILQSPKKTNYVQLRNLVKLFKTNPQLLSVFSSIHEEFLMDRNAMGRWLYVLGLIDNSQSNSILRTMLQNDRIRGDVVRSLISSRVSDCSLLSFLPSFMDKQHEHRVDSIMAFGSLIRRCQSKEHKNKGKQLLNFMQKVAKDTSDFTLSYAVEAAFQNAREDGHVEALVHSIDASNFPFNKSYEKSIQLGGSMLSAEFDLDLFIGTNFDCNQKYFNYAASALANATISFLGDSKSAFLGKAVYGKENGQNLENQLYLRVWNDVIYNTPIPTLDCSQHTYPIGDYKSPGLDVTYTIWVSIIPVTFTAGLDVEMNLEWGWQICDSDLSAVIELIPDAKLVASAGALSDLLVIEGGISLNVDFELVPEPQAFIHGSQCEVGFDVEATYDPMEASVDVWWRENICEWWIFDCHWGPMNTDTLWSWNAAQHHVVLFKDSWKIQP